MNQKTAKKLLQKVVEDYNKISEDFDKTRKSDWKEFELFLDYIKNGQFVADLGCGNGRFYKFISKHREIKYLGIDNNEKLLEKARKDFKKDEKEEFVKGDLISLPLDNEMVDIAVSIASLHHIPSTDFRNKSIQEIHRILKKEGILILTVWNLFQPKYKKYIWKSRLRYILSFGKYDTRDTFIPWGKSGVKRYYYAFTAKELKALLKPHFEIIKEQHENNFVFICKKK